MFYPLLPDFRKAPAPEKDGFDPAALSLVLYLVILLGFTFLYLSK